MNLFRFETGRLLQSPEHSLQEHFYPSGVSTKSKGAHQIPTPLVDQHYGPSESSGLSFARHRHVNSALW